MELEGENQAEPALTIDYYHCSGLQVPTKTSFTGMLYLDTDHGIWSHHFMAKRWGNWKQWLTLFFWAPKSLQMVIAAMKLKDAYSLKGKL